MSSFARTRCQPLKEVSDFGKASPLDGAKGVSRREQGLLNKGFPCALQARLFVAVRPIPRRVPESDKLNSVLRL